MNALAIKSRPIIFSAPMVRALLDGRKTQTRRVGAIQSDEYTELGTDTVGHQTNGYEVLATYRAFPDKGSARWAICACPYGKPGDRLWVREAWGVAWQSDCERIESIELGEGATAFHRADWPDPDVQPSILGWKSPRFMPRWASRITLEVVRVRVERLQDISADDINAEGFPVCTDTAAHEAFANTWDALNGKTYPWSSNPWVWVIEFKRP